MIKNTVMDRINLLEKEVEDLRNLLQAKETELYGLKRDWTKLQNPVRNEEATEELDSLDLHPKVQFDKLPKWAIERYSRQILLPDIGVHGQEMLCAAKVLIVGAGGLGCPAAAYLAGAGVGEIGIVDYDEVEITNIHRQILHSEADEHMSKTESAANSLRSINSKIKVNTYKLLLDPTNALGIAAKYDIILDCSDNVPTRYLLSDLCVLTKIPLISGSALKMDGQLTIYSYRSEKNPKEPEKDHVGPCYRCVFANPPPPETVQSCSANGVAGPVPGVIGALQALEAIKYIVGMTREHLLVERMMIFDGQEMTFRTIKLRSRHPQCAACSAKPSITHLVDYEAFCKAQACEKDLDLHILSPRNRMNVHDLQSLIRGANFERHLLVDVRTATEFQMCRLNGARNFPVDKMHPGKVDGLVDAIETCDGNAIFVCRRGNDSQIVAKMMLDMVGEGHRHKIKDLIGGLHAWSRQVDRNFPVY